MIITILATMTARVRSDTCSAPLQVHLSPHWGSAKLQIDHSSQDILLIILLGNIWQSFINTAQSGAIVVGPSEIAVQSHPVPHIGPSHSSRFN